MTCLRHKVPNMDTKYRHTAVCVCVCVSNIANAMHMIDAMSVHHEDKKSVRFHCINNLPVRLVMSQKLNQPATVEHDQKMANVT